MVDTLLHQGRRTKLIDLLRNNGIKNEKVLEAMLKVPRHYFMDKTFFEHAYDNKAFSIGAGQTISQPYTVAFQTQLLEINRFDKVLEIGTGSGYQAAILAELGVNLYTIERQRNLYLKAQKVFKFLNYRINSYLGDGYEGKPLIAPFNKIILTAAAPEIPKKLLEQLAIGGKMVAPIGINSQEMIVIHKIEENKFETSKHGSFTFVPMLEGVVNNNEN